MSVAIVRDSCSVDFDENVASESKLMSIVVSSGRRCERISKCEDLKGAGAGAKVWFLLFKGTIQRHVEERSGTSGSDRSHHSYIVP